MNFYVYDEGEASFSFANIIFRPRNSLYFSYISLISEIGIISVVYSFHFHFHFAINCK